MADMTLYVRDNRDLRARWDSLLFVEKAVDMAMAQGLSIDGTKAQAYIKDLKQAIRNYNHALDIALESRRYITGDNDSYIELITLPECFDTSLSEKEVAEWFDENERRVCMPSIYDCTGQAFTMWYKAFKRRGRWMLYHKVGFDV